MSSILVWSLHSPIVHGAVIGWATAAQTDYHAFVQFKKWGDLRAYDWSTATFRWFGGMLTGAVMGAGFGAWLS